MKTSECYLYVIGVRDGDGFKAPCKVGISSSPRGRLASLNTGSPFPLGLVGALRLPARDIAEFCERGFHETQAASRLNGEWFDMEPGKALFLVTLLLQVLWSMWGFSEDEVDQLRELTGINAIMADGPPSSGASVQ